MNDIAPRSRDLPLFVESLEGGIYIAQTEIDDQRVPIVREDGRPLREHSIHDLRERLGAFGWQSVTLVQKTAYDEMIGNATEPGSEMRIPLDWTQ